MYRFNESLLNPIEQKSFPICKQGDSYIGESFTLDETLQLANRHRSSNEVLTVWVIDCLSLAQALSSINPTDPIVIKIRTIIARDFPNHTIIWLPSHIKGKCPICHKEGHVIHGNEVADKLAEKAASEIKSLILSGKANQTPDLPNKSSLTMVKAYIHRIVKEDERKNIRNDLQEMAHRHLRFNKELVTFPYKKIPEHISQYLFKSYIGCTHALFLHSRAVHNSPYCPLCTYKSSTQDMVHILHDCPVTCPEARTLAKQFGICTKNSLAAFFLAPDIQEKEEATEYYEALYALLKKAEGPKIHKPPSTQKSE